MGRSNCRARRRSRSLTDGTAGASGGGARALGVSIASVLSPGIGEGACVPSGVSDGSAAVQDPGETAGSGPAVLPSSGPAGDGGAGKSGPGDVPTLPGAPVDAGGAAGADDGMLE